MLLKYQFIPLRRNTVKPRQNLWLVFECQQLSLSLLSITQFNSIHLYYVYHGPKSSARLCWEIDINKIRSFTQIKDLGVKRLGSWGVRLLAKKNQCVFFSSHPQGNYKGSTWQVSRVHSRAKQFHWREMRSKTRPSGWSRSLHLCIPGPGTLS